jgi:hypothetical protein
MTWQASAVATVLIGSADNMLKKKWGEQIDAHDFVVRFNSVMKGFEKDIGTKTDGQGATPLGPHCASQCRIPLPTPGLTPLPLSA